MSMRLFLLIGMTALLLTGCLHDDDDDNNSAGFTPTGEVFTDFVIEQFDADPATAEPVEINDRNFSFLDRQDPSAYDEFLAN